MYVVVDASNPNGSVSTGSFGLAVDPDRNAVDSGEPRVVSPDWTSTLVMVVPTMEELAIARQCVEVVEGTASAS